MKFRFGGACASIILLAGCSGGDPGSQLGQLRGSASSAADKSENSLTAPPVTRDASLSIANSPDRGALMSYRNNGAASKQEGAYTWYPVAISEEHAIKSLLTGEMTIPSPDGGQVKLRYERHEEQSDGNWTWVGRVVDGDQMQEAIITFGEKAVYGSIPQPNGAAPLSLQTRSGSLFAVTTDLSKQKSPNSGATDMMLPPALALRESLAQQVQQQASVQQSATVMASAPPTSSNTIDVAVGYTQGFRAREGSQSAAVTRLTFLMQVANQAYTNSNINGYLRMVRAVEVNYADNTKNSDVLSVLTGHNGTSPVSIPSALQPLHTARNEYGADVVVLVRKFQTPENEGCGIAWLNGADQTAIAPSVDDDFGFAVVSDGSDTGTDGNSYFCAPETLVHEVGHVMGSAHDRDNSRKENNELQYGAYAYSFGMKTDSSNGNFYTIMAYGDNNQHFYRTFSNPSVLKCGSAGNLACGVANQTDNARSLNQTIPLVAQFRSTIVPFVGLVRNDVTGDGKSDLIFRNATSQLVGWWEMNGTTIVKSGNQAAGGTYILNATGDFNGDGRTDLAWTNAARKLVIFTSTGSGFTSTTVSNDFGAGWTLVGAGDINGDGKSDLIFRNASAQLVGWWEMNGTTIVKSGNQAAGGTYTLSAIGDFNGDGRTDLAWTNAARKLVIFTSTGSGFTSTTVSTDFGAGWTLAGAGDINGDGKSDLIFRNASAQLVGWWEMNGTTIVKSGNQAAGGTYTLSATGDFNGDGRTDLAWTNAARKLVIFTSTGSAFTSTTIANDFGAGWSLQSGGP